MNEDHRNELIQYRMKRSQDTFQEVHILIDNKLWNTAVNSGSIFIQNVLLRVKLL